MFTLYNKHIKILNNEEENVRKLNILVRRFLFFYKKKGYSVKLNKEKQKRFPFTIKFYYKNKKKY